MTYRSLTRGPSSTGQDFVIAVPANAAVGDVAVLALYLESTTAVTPPPGFTVITELPYADGTRLVAWWKRVVAAEVGGSWSVALGAATYREANAWLFSGRATVGNPIDVVPTYNEDPSALALTLPGVVASSGADVVALCTSYLTVDWTPPAGMTEVHDFGACMTLAVLNDAPASTHGSKTFMASRSAAMKGLVFTIRSAATEPGVAEEWYFDGAADGTTITTQAQAQAAVRSRLGNLQPNTVARGVATDSTNYWKLTSERPIPGVPPGTLALRHTATGSTQFVLPFRGAQVKRRGLSFGYYIDALPTATIVIAAVLNGSGTPVARILLANNGRISIQHANSSGTAAATTVADSATVASVKAGQWCRLSIVVDAGSTTTNGSILLRAYDGLHDRVATGQVYVTGINGLSATLVSVNIGMSSGISGQGSWTSWMTLVREFALPASGPLLEVPPFLDDDAALRWSGVGLADGTAIAAQAGGSVNDGFVYSVTGSARTVRTGQAVTPAVEFAQATLSADRMGFQTALDTEVGFTFRIRTATANMLAALPILSLLGPASALVAQVNLLANNGVGLNNAANGTASGNSPAMGTGQFYRVTGYVRQDVTTPANGKARLLLYDAAETLVWDSGELTGNFGATGISEVSWGNASTASYPSGLYMAHLRTIKQGTPPPDLEDVYTFPSHDASVDAAATTTNYGSNAELFSRGASSAQETYLRVPLPATPAGRERSAAALVLWASSDASAASADRFDVELMSGTFDESTLTWSNRPTAVASQLVTVPGPAGLQYRQQVTLPRAALRTLTEVVLRLRSSTGSADNARWSSKEASSVVRRPYFVSRQTRATALVTGGSGALSGEGSLTIGGTPTTPGSGALSGDGVLAVAGAAVARGAVSLTGLGELTTASAPRAASSVALTGDGVLSTAAQSVALRGSVALTGDGTLATAGSPRAAGSVPLSGSGTLTPSGTVAVTGSVPLSGSGTLTTTGVARAAGAVALSGSGTLTATGASVGGSTVALSGSGSLTAAGAARLAATLPLSGSGTLTTAGAPSTIAALALTGSGTLTASGAPRAAGSLALTGSGTLTASGTAAARSTVALSGSGSLAASGAPHVAQQVDFAGDGTLASAGSAAVAGSVALTGTGSLSVAAAAYAAGTVALAGDGTLTTTGRPHVAQQLLLTGTGTLAAAGSRMVTDALALTGSGSLTGTGTASSARGALALTGTGTLAATPSLTAARAALALTGTGSLAAQSVAATRGVLALTGTGTLAATDRRAGLAGRVDLSGAGDLIALGRLAARGTVDLAGDGELDLVGATRARGVLDLTGAGDLQLVGAVGSRLLMLSGVGTLVARRTTSPQYGLRGDVVAAGASGVVGSRGGVGAKVGRRGARGRITSGSVSGTLG